MDHVSETSQAPLTAGYESTDAQRWIAEPEKSSYRSAFERDRARLVHSSALRRLGAKTQVLGPGSDDYVRTRLTHTLEVAQVGREIGKALGCDPDVVDAACLAHDLGHPPFGHNGERALAQLSAEIGGFEGNAQTLRLLTRLEPKVLTSAGTSVGLNLTRASLDASIKYPWGFREGPQGHTGEPTTKFGFYADDLPVFQWLRQDAPFQARCMEAQVMDLADDISYSVHDVEDAVVAHRVDLGILADQDERHRVITAVQSWYGPDFDPAELDAAIDRLRATGHLVAGFDGSRGALAALKDATSQLIGRFSAAAHHATRAIYGPGPLTRYSAELIVPEQTLAEIIVLKGIAVAYVMAPRERRPQHEYQRRILQDLVQCLSAQAPEHLEPHFAVDWIHAESDAQRLRVIIDQVASLTDWSAHQWHDALVAGRS